jgi:hypothetical protein
MDVDEVADEVVADDDPLDAQAYSEMKVSELKALLKERNLKPEKNLKMFMIKRLEQEDKRVELDAGIITISIKDAIVGFFRTIKISKTATGMDLKLAYANQRGLKGRNIRYLASFTDDRLMDDDTLERQNINDGYVLVAHVDLR